MSYVNPDLKVDYIERALEQRAQEAKLPPLELSLGEVNTIIRNHLAVARNSNVDELLRLRAIRELEKFRGTAEVDAFLESVQDGSL